MFCYYHFSFVVTKVIRNLIGIRVNEHVNGYNFDDSKLNVIVFEYDFVYKFRLKIEDFEGKF